MDNPWLKWIPDVKPMELVQWLTTLGLAYYLNRILTTRKNSLQVEKDALIQLLREIESKGMEAFEAAEADSNEERIKAVRRLREASNAIALLGEVSIACEDERIQQLHKPIDELVLMLEQLKRAITGGNYPAGKLSGEQLSQALRAQRDLREKLHKLQLKVSRLG